MSETESAVPNASATDEPAPEVLYEVADHVATITLNRPHRLNAISSKMLATLGRLLEQADEDDDVRCIILTGAGKGFCSGLDLVDAAEGSGIGGEQAMKGMRHMSTRTLPTNILFNVDKPTICALNGAAAGYGLDLALGCDIRLAARSAKIVPGFAKRGVVPESGGTWYLPAHRPRQGRRDRVLGRNLSAEEAEGYDSSTSSPTTSNSATSPVIGRPRSRTGAPLAVQAMKRLYRHAWTEDFESHSHHVLLQVMQLFKSNDFKEGIDSYFEKRPPKFTGS
ncbi:MAG: enoyl-CoA hydratase/isomerase family protein [Acidimicrobiales bacterium]